LELLDRELLNKHFLNIIESDIKRILKYQEKFGYTLRNLKCLNPNCNNLRKWFNTKWGYGHTCGNDECKQKTKETVLQLGVLKNKQTYFKRTGFNHPTLNPEVKEKYKQTYFKRTGYKNPANNPEVQERKRVKHREQFGVDYFSQRQDIQEKIRITNQKKYGTSSHNNKHITNYQYWYDRQYWINNFVLPDNSFDNKKCRDFFNCSKDTINIKILELDIFRKKNKSVSETELQIRTLLSSYSLQLNTQTVIKPLELDIYIPDKKVAIEYNGIYWHSYMKDDYSKTLKQTDHLFCKNRHKQKTDACLLQDIQLFHIFENEWIDPIKQNIWKSVIENALGKSKRLGARKCQIKQVPKKDIKPFLEHNHLQGYGVSPIAYGLYYMNELVSIMTFASSKGRMDINTDWELIRFCNKLGYNVQGAASRLLKAFRTKHSGSIKSYANRRWSNGNLYRQLGFKEIGISKPNFFYWHLNNHKLLYSRQHFQKHKLLNILNNFNNKLSSTQNLLNNKYAIIYDSGNYTFLLE
jgi:hypothetical protein